MVKVPVGTVCSSFLLKLIMQLHVFLVIIHQFFKKRQKMKLLGVTGSSVLVTFDPTTGAIVEKHVWLNPNEKFRG